MYGEIIGHYSIAVSSNYKVNDLISLYLIINLKNNNYFFIRRASVLIGLSIIPETNDTINFTLTIKTLYHE